MVKLICAYPAYEVGCEDEDWVLRYSTFSSHAAALEAGAEKMGAYCKIVPEEEFDKERISTLEKIRNGNFDPESEGWF